LVECIRHQCWLNHCERVVYVGVVEDVSVKRGLVGRVVEDLQELTSTQMEHELRVNAEALAQLETGGICRETCQ